MEQDVNRKCIVSGEIKDKQNLLRFVMLEGQIVPDFQKKIKGKGVYVTNSKKMLQQAIEKKCFARVFKKNFVQDEKLVEIVENIMRTRGLSFLNLARKAGVLIAGFEKVKEKLKQNKVEFVVEANDGANDGKEKIFSLLKGVPVFNFYSIDDLDNALNRTNTVHLAFLKSDMAKAALNEFQRIDSFFDLNDKNGDNII